MGFRMGFLKSREIAEKNLVFFSFWNLNFFEKIGVFLRIMPYLHQSLLLLTADCITPCRAKKITLDRPQRSLNLIHLFLPRFFC